jgi:hypothetical protein
MRQRRKWPRLWRTACRLLWTWGALASLIYLLWLGLNRIRGSDRAGWLAFFLCAILAAGAVAFIHYRDSRTRRARAKLLAQPGWEYGFCEKCKYPLRVLPLKQRLVRGLWMYRRECPECGHASW